MLFLASFSVILTHRMQVKRRKGTIQVLIAKTKAPKMVNCTRSVQIVFLPVKITIRSPNFLENIFFSRNWAIKLLIAEILPVAFVWIVEHNPNRTKNLFSFPLGKLKNKKRSTSPLNLASGNLGGAAIAIATESCMQQPIVTACPTLHVTLWVQSLLHSTQTRVVLCVQLLLSYSS